MLLKRSDDTGPQDYDSIMLTGKEMSCVKVFMLAQRSTCLVLVFWWLSYSESALLWRGRSALEVRLVPHVFECAIFRAPLADPFKANGFSGHPLLVMESNSPMEVCQAFGFA